MSSASTEGSVFLVFFFHSLSTTTMPASRSLVVVWPVRNTICCFHFRSAQISFPHEKIVIASYPFGIIDRHALWEVSFPLQLRILTAETDTSDEEYEYQSYGGHHNYKYTLGCDEMDDLIPDLCSFC